MTTFLIMIINIIFFFIFSLIMVLLSVYSSVYLLLTLIVIAFCIIGLLFLLQLEWFGLLLGIIYLGSIIVLFLFVVMLLKLQPSQINYKKIILNLIFFIFIFAILYFYFFFDIIKNILNIYTYINLSSILFYTSVALVEQNINELFFFDQLLNLKEINLYLITDLFIYFYTFEGSFILLILLWLLVLVLIGITNILTLLKDKNIYLTKQKIKINKKL